MMEFVRAARSAAESGNVYGALALALTLPDMACSLESADGWTSGRRYSAWVDRWLDRRYLRFLEGGDCYALRCAVLHNGSDRTENHRASVALDRFVFTTQGGHLLRVNSLLQMNTPAFVEDLCLAVEAWMNTVGATETVRTRTAGGLRIRKSGNLLVVLGSDGQVKLQESE